MTCVLYGDGMRSVGIGLYVLAFCMSRLTGIHLVGVWYLEPKTRWIRLSPIHMWTGTFLYRVHVCQHVIHSVLWDRTYKIINVSLPKCIVYGGGCQSSAFCLLHHNVCHHWGTHSRSMDLLVALPIVSKVGGRKAEVHKWNCNVCWIKAGWISKGSTERRSECLRPGGACMERRPQCQLGLNGSSGCQ